MLPHYRSLEAIQIENSWLTIGVFDGVHRGHQEIIQLLVAGARQAGAPAVVLSFHPHPAEVLGGKEIRCLTTPDERAELLVALGVDVVITEAFTRSLAETQAADFMKYLKERLGLRHLLVGYDFALGHNREGDYYRLSALGKELDYEVRALPAVSGQKGIISSSFIRQRLMAGQVGEAAEALGRFYAVSGPVVHGDGRGKKINIPTANIAFPERKVVPANGVYACWAWVGDERHPAVTNVGIRPTFTPDQETPHIETHLLDFSQELYDREIKLEFVARLRDEMRFSSVGLLIAQIQDDILEARSLLQA